MNSMVRERENPFPASTGSMLDAYWGERKVVEGEPATAVAAVVAKVAAVARAIMVELV